MIKLLRDKKAKTLHTAMINIIKETGAIPTIVYCDKGSEFDNRLFNDPKTNFLKYNLWSTDKKLSMQNVP